jgi:hypothetical protein
LSGTQQNHAHVANQTGRQVALNGSAAARGEDNNSMSLRAVLGALFRQPSQGNRRTEPARGEAVQLVVPEHTGRTVQYPPQDPGFVCPQAADMVDAQEDLVRMLRTHAAATPTIFDERFRQPLVNLAEFIGNLPATASSVFAGEGGLMRAAVETAFNSYRASDGRIFTGASTVEDRHLLEGRWRYVCFLAGLMYPVGASLQAMIVLDAAGTRWSPELDAIQTWAGVGKRYWVSWKDGFTNPGPAPVMGMAVHRIAGRQNLDWLNQGSHELTQRMVEIVTSAPGASTAVATTVVRGVWERVHEREVARRHQNYGRLVVGSHISPYIIDAMVMLTQSRWKPNENTLFIDKTGAYLVWPAAGQDIIDYCQERGYAGIPASTSSLLSILITNQIVTGGVDSVAMHEIANEDSVIVAAVKLTKPGMLIEDVSAYSNPIARPVLMTAVVAADPLASVVKVEQPVSKPSKTDPVEGTPKRPAGAAKDVKGGSNASVKAQTWDEPAGAERATDDAAVVAPEATTAPAPVVEGPPKKYAATLPQEVVKKLKPFSAELLGKVLSGWTERAQGARVIRMTDVGAAFELDYVMECGGGSTRAMDAIDDWARSGYLYFEPTRPGVRIHKLALVDGGQTAVNCLIFSSGSVKLFGLVA